MHVNDLMNTQPHNQRSTMLTSSKMTEGRPGGVCKCLHRKRDEAGSAEEQFPAGQRGIGGVIQPNRLVCFFLNKAAPKYSNNVHKRKLFDSIASQLETDFAENSKGIKGKAKWLVYLNHFITGWDDNIWSFALGLFLVEISPQSLQFTATYGLVAGCAVLLFGTLVGDWVDRTPRLTVARVSVLVQNSALILCSLLIYVVLEHKSEIAALAADEALLRVCYAFIVVIAIISNLTNMARKTAIERDWIVEICNKDADMLAHFSATMRRISLVTMVIAPIVTGQILTRTSHPTGALVVAGWNFVTIFVEYFLLWKVYQEVPQLHRLKVKEDSDTANIITLMQGVDAAMEFSHISHADGNKPEPTTIELQPKSSPFPNNVQEKYFEAPLDNTVTSNPDNNSKQLSGKKDTLTSEVQDTPVVEHRSMRGCISALCSSCTTLSRGWSTYRNYNVAFAGLSLSSLYLTVLGFDGITTGFAYSQGLSEDLIGGLLAAAACTGIVGTILYPYARKRFGLQRTGLYAIAAEISSLTLCVMSVWSPGSPFDPLYFTRELSTATSDIASTTNTSTMSTLHSANGSIAAAATESSADNAHAHPSSAESYVSISLLMAGIIGARVGLWMADLTITQLFLETVDVTERGIISGVQNAMNQLMDMLKFAIVILLPVPQVFGYLIIISFCFICLGWILFAVYVKKTRGYVCPCFRDTT